MSIDAKIVRDLLEKYYNGNTSIEEEDLLLDYFSQSNSSDEFLIDKEFFQSLYQSRDEAIDFDPETLINNAISQVKVEKPSETSFNRYIKQLVYWSAAASILIIIGLGIFITNKQNEKLLADTFDDPYQAMQETRRVLAFMADKLNTGQTQLEPLSNLNRANDVLEPINEMSRNLLYINRIEELEQPKKIPFLKDLLYNKEEE